MTDPTRILERALADRYRIERELGAGGMATVYLAHDVKHDRDVAIKVLKPELAESLGRDRFLREIRMAAGLTHPHILPLYDSGEADGLLFYQLAGEGRSGRANDDTINGADESSLADPGPTGRFADAEPLIPRRHAFQTGRALPLPPIAQSNHGIFFA